MAISINPYVHFVDNAQEALDFYKQALGAEVTINKFGEFGTPDNDPSHDLIMHAEVTFAGTKFFVSDSLPMGGVKQGGENVELSITGGKADDEQLTQYFTALSDGATITAPLETAPWGAKFGMLVDKFGIHWMVNVDQNS
jgi:PhnB protein